jgi:hypothetical protein
MKFFILIALFILAACGKSEKSSSDTQKIFVVGDSISIGYTPYIAKQLPESKVVHNFANGRSSSYGVERIKGWAAVESGWDVCTINHGIWDSEDVGVHITTITDYVSNLKKEINFLRTVCKKVMFATTTSIPVNAPHITDIEVQERNAAATALMDEMNVPVCDLYPVSQGLDDLRRDANLQNDVHYVGEGYEILASEMVKCMKDLN